MFLILLICGLILDIDWDDPVPSVIGTVFIVLLTSYKVSPNCIKLSSIL